MKWDRACFCSWFDADEMRWIGVTYRNLDWDKEKIRTWIIKKRLNNNIKKVF